jgi:hypothetical protein
MIVLEPLTKVTTSFFILKTMDEKCTYTLPLLTNSKYQKVQIAQHWFEPFPKIWQVMKIGQSSIVGKKGIHSGNGQIVFLKNSG